MKGQGLGGEHSGVRTHGVAPGDCEGLEDVARLFNDLSSEDEAGEREQDARTLGVAQDRNGNKPRRTSLESLEDALRGLHEDSSLDDLMRMIRGESAESVTEEQRPRAVTLQKNPQGENVPVSGAQYARQRSHAAVSLYSVDAEVSEAQLIKLQKKAWNASIMSMVCGLCVISFDLVLNYNALCGAKATHNDAVTRRVLSVASATKIVAEAVVCAIGCWSMMENSGCTVRGVSGSQSVSFRLRDIVPGNTTPSAAAQHAMVDSIMGAVYKCSPTTLHKISRNKNEVASTFMDLLSRDEIEPVSDCHEVLGQGTTPSVRARMALCVKNYALPALLIASGVVVIATSAVYGANAANHQDEYGNGTSIDSYASSPCEQAMNCMSFLTTAASLVSAGLVFWAQRASRNIDKLQKNAVDLVGVPVERGDMARAIKELEDSKAQVCMQSTVTPVGSNIAISMP